MEVDKTFRTPLSFLKRKEIVLILRLLLGVVFIWASIHKVQNPEQLAITTRSYQIIPVSLSNIFALSLAWSELIAGMFLVFGVFTKQAASTVAILLTMFIVAICATLARGIIIDCGCFDETGHPVDIFLLVRNLFLLLAACLVIRFDRGFASLRFPRRVHRS